MKALLPLVIGLLAPLSASAQETIDLGVLKNSDIKVVQKVLYPKEGRTELGIHVGWMPFDAYASTPVASFTFGSFMTDTVSWEAAVSGGYGLKTAAFRELEGPMYGVAPDAYRYLAGVSGDLQWAPIYAKMNLAGSKIVHYDVYVLAGAGLSVEDSMVLPDLEIALAPGAALGIGSRFFLSKDAALRVQLRDDILLEMRSPTTGGSHLKHATAVTVGYSILSKVKE